MVARNKEKCQLLVLSPEENKELEFSFFADEFVMTFYVPHVIIKKEESETFYSTFSMLFDQTYQFSNPDLNYQEKNKIVWYSDVYGDLENPRELEMISYLTMEKDENQISFDIRKSFFEEMNIPMRDGVIAFSPAGNGRYARNVVTEKNFQDEVIGCFWNCLENRKVKEKSGDFYE